MRDSYMFYTDKLKGEYWEAFHQVETYADGFAYRMGSFEERMMELLDIFLSAQEKGRPVTAVTGTDMEQFCKNFCEGCSWQGRLWDFAAYLKNISWWLLIVSVVELLFILADWDEKSGNLFLAATDMEIGSYLIGIAAGWLLIGLFQMAVRHIMFKVRHFHWKLYSAVSVLLMIGLVVGLFVFYCNHEIGVFAIPVIPMGLVCGGYLAVYYICRRKWMPGEELPKVKFMDLLESDIKEDASSEGQLTQGMHKQLERINRRRKCRGKEEWDWEAYISYLERDEKTSKNVFKLYLVIPFLLAVFFTFLSWSDGESVTLPDIASCFFMVLLVSAVIFAIIYLIIRLPFKARWEWIHRQREILEREKDEKQQGVPQPDHSGQAWEDGGE